VRAIIASVDSMRNDARTTYVVLRSRENMRVTADELLSTIFLFRSKLGR